MKKNKVKNEGWFDKKIIDIVLQNLLSNAFKFTDENGEIVLTAESVSYKSHSIKFTVTDNGRGIPEKDLRNIFKRFFQADNQKKEEAGSGIGLALAKSLVELHLGEIHISQSVSGNILKFHQRSIPNLLMGNPKALCQVHEILVIQYRYHMQYWIVL